MAPEITSDSQHDEALAELDRLMDAKPDPGSDESQRLVILAKVIEAYERKRWPIGEPTLLEAEAFRLEQEGMSSIMLALEKRDRWRGLAGQMVEMVTWLVAMCDQWRKAAEGKLDAEIERDLRERMDAMTADTMRKLTETTAIVLDGMPPEMIRRMFAEAGSRLTLYQRRLEDATGQVDRLTKANAELAEQVAILRGALDGAGVPW